MSLTLPSKLGPYEIASRLGAGGMGEVYRARDERLGREVALKLLREEHAADADRLARFGQEARSASALNHPNIVTIFDIGEAEGRHFIAMELVRGRTIRSCLERGPLSTATLLDFAVQIADGLARAHEAGIVHRDLKPDNLMVTDDGLVKILDFGLAKLIRRPFDVDSEGETIAGPTRSGTLLGTVGYMSPEQASGDRVDHRTDQFTFGLVLHEMATGERPFDRRTAAQTLAAIIEADAPPLDSRNKTLPASLAGVVARCLSKDPGLRFESTRDLALALRGIRNHPATAVMPAPLSVLGPERALVRARGPEGSYQVQVDGHIKAMSEKKLRARVRSNSFSGLELIRRDGEDRWELLHDSSVFREEVPLVGDPRDAARFRILESFAGHVATFVAVGAFMSFPPWMVFWGIGLASHAFKAMPAVLGLIREGKLRLPGRRSGSLPALRKGEDVKRLPPADFMAEVERVRSLLMHRDKDDARGLLAEIDRLVSSMSALTAKLADLEEQTSHRESERLLETERQAQARLGTAAAYDREILTRQLEVLGHRRRAMEKALVLIERMRVRRSMAEHQLKQLRLDLSQAEARRMEAPELSSRILDIRDEVDALDEVDELLAHG